MPYMQSIVEKGKADAGVFIIGRNDGTVAITAGQPVVWQMDGTRDGLDVVTSKEGTAASDPLLVGLAHEGMAIGSAQTETGYGLIQIYGYDDDAVCMYHGTGTSDSAVVGDLMYVRTDLNALSCVKPGTTMWTIASVSSNGTTPQINLPIHMGRIVCCSAHTANGTSTITVASRVFLRLM
jgi:hypothetical protein